MDFDWKAVVPVWAVLRWIDIRARVDQPNMITGWKATPKGGKLSYTINGAPYQVQLYK